MIYFLIAIALTPGDRSTFTYKQYTEEHSETVVH